MVASYRVEAEQPFILEDGKGRLLPSGEAVVKKVAESEGVSDFTAFNRGGSRPTRGHHIQSSDCVPGENRYEWHLLPSADLWLFFTAPTATCGQSGI